MEQTKNGSKLINASEATTWIDIAYLEGRRSIQLSYGRTVTATLILEHFWIIPKKNPIINAALLLGTFPVRASPDGDCWLKCLAFHPHIVLKLFLVNLDAFMLLLLRFCFSK